MATTHTPHPPSGPGASAPGVRPPARTPVRASFALAVLMRSNKTAVASTRDPGETLSRTDVLLHRIHKIETLPQLFLEEASLRDVIDGNEANRRHHILCHSLRGQKFVEEVAVLAAQETAARWKMEREEQQALWLGGGAVHAIACGEVTERNHVSQNEFDVFTGLVTQERVARLTLMERAERLDFTLPAERLQRDVLCQKFDLQSSDFADFAAGLRRYQSMMRRDLVVVWTHAEQRRDLEQKEEAIREELRERKLQKLSLLHTDLLLHHRRIQMHEIFGIEAQHRSLILHGEQELRSSFEARDILDRHVAGIHYAQTEVHREEGRLRQRLTADEAESWHEVQVAEAREWHTCFQQVVWARGPMTSVEDHEVFSRRDAAFEKEIAWSELLKMESAERVPISHRDEERREFLHRFIDGRLALSRLEDAQRDAYLGHSLRARQRLQSTMTRAELCSRELAEREEVEFVQWKERSVHAVDGELLLVQVFESSSRMRLYEAAVLELQAIAARQVRTARTIGEPTYLLKKVEKCEESNRIEWFVAWSEDHENMKSDFLAESVDAKNVQRVSAATSSSVGPVEQSARVAIESLESSDFATVQLRAIREVEGLTRPEIYRNESVARATAYRVILRLAERVARGAISDQRYHELALSERGLKSIAFKDEIGPSELPFEEFSRALGYDELHYRFENEVDATAEINEAVQWALAACPALFGAPGSSAPVFALDHTFAPVPGGECLVKVYTKAMRALESVEDTLRGHMAATAHRNAHTILIAFREDRRRHDIEVFEISQRAAVNTIFSKIRRMIDLGEVSQLTADLQRDEARRRWASVELQHRSEILALLEQAAHEAPLPGSSRHAFDVAAGRIWEQYFKAHDETQAEESEFRLTQERIILDQLFTDFVIMKARHADQIRSVERNIDAQYEASNRVLTAPRTAASRLRTAPFRALTVVISEMKPSVLLCSSLRRTLAYTDPRYAWAAHRDAAARTIQHAERIPRARRVLRGKRRAAQVDLEAQLAFETESAAVARTILASPPISAE